jgi:hypothetical protein
LPTEIVATFCAVSIQSFVDRSVKKPTAAMIDIPSASAHAHHVENDRPSASNSFCIRAHNSGGASANGSDFFGMGDSSELT